ERGFFLPMAEGLELYVDGFALRKQELDGLLSELFGLFDDRHKAGCFVRGSGLFFYQFDLCVALAMRQVTRSSVDAIPLTVFSFNLSLIAESSAVFIAVEKLDVVKSDSSPFVD